MNSTEPSAIKPNGSGARQRVLMGETLFGAFVNVGSPVAAEIMASSGLDWLVVDLEHGAGDEPTALAQVQAIAAHDVIGLIRVESLERTRINRALDTGAAGVLVPRLNGVEDAEFAVSCCRYSGMRGVARGNRAWGWGPATHADFASADERVVCAVQIETEAALQSVKSIAAVDGVDVLFIGPGDLGYSLGIDGPPGHPQLLAAARTVAEAAAANGKAAGVLVETAEQAEMYLKEGFTFVGCSTDGSLLSRSARGLVGSLSALRSVRHG